MADTTSALSAHVRTPNTQTVTAAPYVGELTIVLDPQGSVAYLGTIAQLQAEGLVPASVVLPHGALPVSWTAGEQNYYLFRKKPKGFKGNKAQWGQMDHWQLTVLPANNQYRDAGFLKLQRTREAWARQRHAISPQGKAEWHAAFIKFLQARDDKAYCAFKSKYLPNTGRVRIAPATGKGVEQ